MSCSQIECVDFLTETKGGATVLLPASQSKSAAYHAETSFALCLSFKGQTVTVAVTNF